MATKTQWHVVQNVKTGLYHVVRHEPGKTEEDMEFLLGRGGFPLNFSTGELADKAATRANSLRWQEAMCDEQYVRGVQAG
ncbi:MAG: hypothetical protein RJA36_1123 [Pseudomonadota bacterium]|jgi:hypothetical protein